MFNNIFVTADEIGKWWIVGSAWSGSNDTNIKSNIKEQNKLSFRSDILELARRQRMNTDTRRNIFCILVTAEDYIDAFEKLHHLGLKDHQEGEIVHVLMHCCLHESKFNPYYAVLGKKLCDYNRKYQVSYAFFHIISHNYRGCTKKISQRFDVKSWFFVLNRLTPGSSTKHATFVFH